MEEITKTVYKTNDGMLFENRDEAEKHEAAVDLKEELQNIEALVKEIEIAPDDPNSKFLIPVEDFLKNGSNGQSLKRIKNLLSLRYFMVNNPVDVERLARYVALKRQIRDKTEGNEDISDTLTWEDIAKTFSGNFPCAVFINDRFKGVDHFYNSRIGSFNEQMHFVEEYCKKNGYKLKWFRE